MNPMSTAASLRSTRHPTGGADLFRYDLSLTRGDDHWRGTVSQASVPAALRDLLPFLVGLAR
jgi:hypothetical protein